jgi:hypothetical protein
MVDTGAAAATASTAATAATATTAVTAAAEVEAAAMEMLIGDIVTPEMVPSEEAAVDVVAMEMVAMGLVAPGIMATDLADLTTARDPVAMEATMTVTVTTILGMLMKSLATATMVVAAITMLDTVVDITTAPVNGVPKLYLPM